MTKYGIDVSYHNGVIDWTKVKASRHVDFAILRAGYGKVISQKDKNFESYYKNCKALDIPVGAYWYSYALTPTEARTEAQVFLKCIEGKQFEYPVFFDLEEQKAFATGKTNCSNMVVAFCDELEKAGYWAGLYMSRSPFTDYISENLRDRYALWLAEYNRMLNYSGAVGMWQKSSSGAVAGISTKTDLNECYIDYPALIKAAGKNGFPKSVENHVETVEKKSIDIMIKINGEDYSGTVYKD